jgi:hypothetical protein
VQFDKEHSEFGERAAAVGSARKAFAQAGQDPDLVFKDLAGLPGRDKPYQVFAHKNEGLDGLAARVSRSGIPATVDELTAAAVSTYGGTPEEAVARLLQQGQINQQIAEPHIQGMVKGSQRVASAIGAELLADPANQDPGLFQALGIEPGQIRQRYGSQPVTDAAGTAAPAAASTAEPAVTDAAAAAVTGGTAEVPVAVASNFPSWVPRHPGLSDLESAMAYGGLGLGGAALAGYLMSQGQVQSSPNDYAAAAAAMNAYV